MDNILSRSILLPNPADFPFMLVPHASSINSKEEIVLWKRLNLLYLLLRMKRLVDCIETSQHIIISSCYSLQTFGSAYSRVIPNSSHDVLLSSPQSEDNKLHQRRYFPILAANRLLEKVIFPRFTTSIWIIFRFRSLVTICAVSGSSLNPFVYVFRNESVRKEATRVVCWYVEFLIFMNFKHGVVLV